MDILAILQIRTGSTRLPGKMLSSFFEDQTIPELIIRNLFTVLEKSQILIATTDQKGDDPIEQLAKDLGVKCFRGSEDDVLQRFLGAIEQESAKSVIRICADNPFLRMEYIEELISEYQKGGHEYITFEFPDGTPIMKSHIGLFAEIMSADFLRKLDAITTEPIFREHVTNYVYDHKEDFRTLFLPVPEMLAYRRDIRLTIDTGPDFEVSSALYRNLVSNDAAFSVEDILVAIDNDPKFSQSMKREIELNSK